MHVLYPQRIELLLTQAKPMLHAGICRGWLAQRILRKHRCVRTRQCFSKASKISQPHSLYLASSVVRHSTKSASTVSGRSRLCSAPTNMTSLNRTNSGASPANVNYLRMPCFES